MTGGSILGFIGGVSFCAFNSCIIKNIFLVYSRDQLYKHICMQNHNDDTIKTSDLSLYLKGLCVRGGWRQNRTATY